MNITTNLLEDDVNFVDITKKQNTSFEVFILSFAIIVSLFLFFTLF